MQNLDGEHGCGLEVWIRIVRQYERCFHGDLVAVVHKDCRIDKYGVASLSDLGVPVENERLHITVDVKLRGANSRIKIVIDCACNGSLELVVELDVRERDRGNFGVVCLLGVKSVIFGKSMNPRPRSSTSCKRSESALK